MDFHFIHFQFSNTVTVMGQIPTPFAAFLQVGPVQDGDLRDFDAICILPGEQLTQRAAGVQQADGMIGSQEQAGELPMIEYRFNGIGLLAVGCTGQGFGQVGGTVFRIVAQRQFDFESC